MIIAVASGKGGTGKTTVAVSLALSLLQRTSSQPTTSSTKPLIFVDCDVEEPNAAHFLKPTLEERKEVGQMIPEVDEDACTHCGRCAEVCQYNCIAVFGKKVMVFPDLCHGCGSCTLSCPVGAIHEVLHVMGTLERGRVGTATFAQGTLNVGQAMSVPIIRQLKQWLLTDAPSNQLAILDAPPGTSCPVVETLRGSDFVLMVTEPTPFGLHDLRIAVQVARDELKLPVAVVINRDGIGDRGVEDYCATEGIPILMRIPMTRRIAEGCADGKPLIDTAPEYRDRFVALQTSIERLVAMKPETSQ